MLKPGDVVRFKDGRFGRVTPSVEELLGVFVSKRGCSFCLEEFGSSCMTNKEGIPCSAIIGRHCYFTRVHNYEGELQSLISGEDETSS